MNNINETGINFILLQKNIFSQAGDGNKLFTVTFMDKFFFHPGCGQIVETHLLAADMANPVSMRNSVQCKNISCENSFMAVDKRKIVALDPAPGKISKAKCSQKFREGDNRHLVK